MADSFWKQVRASLPSQAQRRCAREIEAIQRFEILMELAGDAWRFARRALGKGCRAASRMLDHVAQRLLLTR